MANITLDQLIRARALIEDEAFWIQGLREDGFGLAHCAFGALNYIISEDKRSDVDASHPTLIALLLVIRQTAKDIPKEIVEDHAPFNLMWFNDNHSHTEVLALFDRAIERQRLIDDLKAAPPVMQAMEPVA